MAKAVINLITPPDKLYTKALSFFLINPNNVVKEQFNDVFKKLKRTVNLYLFEERHTPDITWLIDVVHHVDYVILDIDNSEEIRWMIGYILSFDKTYYLTKDMVWPYNIINSNRIFEVQQFAEVEKYFAQKK